MGDLNAKGKSVMNFGCALFALPFVLFGVYLIAVALWEGAKHVLGIG